MTYWVLREESQHLHPIRIDDTFEDLAPRWRLLILVVPLRGEPCHLVLAVEKRIVFTTLLPLWRLDWMLILVENRWWTLPLMILWLLRSLRLVAIFFKLLRRFAEEFEVNN